MVTKDELRAVILECAEFLRDELEARTFDMMPPRAAERITAQAEELKAKCYRILDNPSIVEVERIKAKVKGK